MFRKRIMFSYILRNNDPLIQCISLVESSNEEELTAATTGTIVSPNYPENYGNHENKKYYITAPPFSTIMLFFDDVNIEFHSNCQYDSLKVRWLRWFQQECNDNVRDKIIVTIT